MGRGIARRKFAPARLALDLDGDDLEISQPRVIAGTHLLDKAFAIS